jgi:hypothetical protein
MGDFGRSMVPDCDATASARARRCCCAIAVSILSGILFQNRRGLGLPSTRLHFVSDLRDDVDACGFSEGDAARPITASQPPVRACKTSKHYR